MLTISPWTAGAYGRRDDQPGHFAQTAALAPTPCRLPPMAAPRAVRAGRHRGGGRGRRPGAGGRLGGPGVPCHPYAPAVCRALADAGRLRGCQLRFAPVLPRLGRQRHSAGDRGTAGRAGHTGRAGLAAAGRGQSRAPAAGAAVRRLDRPRGTHRAGGCQHHVRGRPPVAAPAVRPDPGRRRRRCRRRVQHAAGRHRVRHRGDEPVFRGAHQRRDPGHGDRRRPHLAGPAGRLHLFRPDPRDVARCGGLDGPAPGGCRRWPRRRRVQPGADRVRPRRAGVCRAYGGPPPRAVCRNLRAGGGGVRAAVPRCRVRHRLCRGNARWCSPAPGRHRPASAR